MALNKAMIFIFVVCVSLCFNSSNGYKFNVGGKDGWVVHPSEDYSHWSHRNRFVINDTLYFKYNRQDSVLQVNEAQFYNCNTTNPLSKFDDGSSEFKLARSGPFFFITGVKVNCEKGLRLHLVVLSEHHHYRHSSSVFPPSISPSPSPATPHRSAPAPTPASPSPKLSPSPVSYPPKRLPSPAPTSSPVHSVSPPPKRSPAPASTSSPANPERSPSPAPSVSPASAPAKQLPEPAVSPATPFPEEDAPVPSPGRAADDENSPAPAPGKNAASKILMGLPVTIILMAGAIGVF